ncbi:MAG TPA: hypothetical protein VFB79_07430 [Candidatus Angelobacter sp.]|nr:hypothetical protein [Candidatus Angelobacter sp.]
MTDTMNQTDIIEALIRTIELCEQAQQKHYDDRIATVLPALRSILDDVRSKWPLSFMNKKEINIGLYAMREIMEVHPYIADVLMKLDYRLTHDGKGTEPIFTAA